MTIHAVRPITCAPAAALRAQVEALEKRPSQGEQIQASLLDGVKSATFGGMTGAIAALAAVGADVALHAAGLPPGVTVTYAPLYKIALIGAIPGAIAGGVTELVRGAATGESNGCLTLPGIVGAVAGGAVAASLTISVVEIVGPMLVH